MIVGGEGGKMKERTSVLRAEDEMEPLWEGQGLGRHFPGKEIFIGFEVWFKADTLIWGLGKFCEITIQDWRTQQGEGLEK